MAMEVLDSLTSWNGSGRKSSGVILAKTEQVEDVLSRRILKEIMACGAALSFFLIAPGAAQATNINLAVASNFYGDGVAGTNTSIIADIISDFQNAYSGYTVTVVANGATQTLKNQITTGNTSAVDLFLAADYTTPQDLAANYSTMVTGQAFPYALGVLAILYNTTAYNVSCGGAGSCGFTTGAGYTSVAIAAPTLAPYGEAARELLWQQFGIDYTTVTTIHTYTNITAAYNAVVNRTDPVGFVALSALCTSGNYPKAITTPLPANVQTAYAYSPFETTATSIARFYKPLLQGGIAITIGTSRTGPQNTELTAFKTFLQNFTVKVSSSTSDSAMVTRLKQYCYSPPSQ